jgi:hypothetical protein
VTELGITFNSLPKDKQNSCMKFIIGGQIAEKFSLGNCREQTASAFVYLMRNHPDLQLKVYDIVNGDHRFLVVGEGENAVVCDPWSGRAYPFSEIIIHLKNYKGCAADGSPVLETYHPKKHKLRVNFVFHPSNGNITSFV